MDHTAEERLKKQEKRRRQRQQKSQATDAPATTPATTSTPQQQAAPATTSTTAQDLEVKVGVEAPPKELQDKIKSIIRSNALQPAASEEEEAARRRHAKKNEHPSVVQIAPEVAAASHAFWGSQPVPVLGAQIPAELNHPIDPDQPLSEVPREPLKLPNETLRWCDIAVSDPVQLSEAYTLLTENYVEDDDAMFRFDYSADFLRWALTPPGYYNDWIVGVRDASTGKLMAMITGIPVHIKVHGRGPICMAEINFLCVHKSLRALRMAPTLISEVTRRVHLRGMFQAVYTAGVLLPSPISECQYYHRSLNPKKLLDVGFSGLGPRQTVARLIKLNKLPETPSPNSRAMVAADVPVVHALLNEYLSQFSVIPYFTKEEIEHWFLPRAGVINAYVHCNDPAGNKDKITGFSSFYHLPSNIIGNAKHKTLFAAYSFYNFNTVGPVQDVMQQSLIYAHNAGFDVFNCLDVMQNDSFIKDIKFGPGDGKLRYYLYNWACPAVTPSKLGLVLL